MGLLQKIYLIIKYSKLMGFMYKQSFFYGRAIRTKKIRLVSCCNGTKRINI